MVKQRDRALRRVYQGRGVANLSPQSDDFPPAPPYSAQPQSTVLPHSMTPTHVAQYADTNMRYATGGDPSISLGGAFHHSGGGQDFSHRSPAMTPFASSIDANTSTDGRLQQMESQRMARYDQYSYAMNNSNQDGTWMAEDQAGPSSSDVLDSGSSSHSPNYVESPTLTSSELTYSAQFAVDEQKVSLATLNSSYVYPSSRSISPAVSTPTSTSSNSLAPSPYPFTFPEASVVQDRPEFGYRRQQPAPHLTLHGGTADISVAASSRDAARYRLPNRPNIQTDRPITHALSSYSRMDNNSGGRDSDDSEAASYTYSSRSRQRSDAPSSRASRSPSPGPPPICGTLAVIKAQAFGALRRTRTRSRKASEGAAKAAVEALEARGIGMGLSGGAGSKRPRLLVDDGDVHT